MAVNKVEYGGDTLIDLTGDSVTPQTLAEGETAHNAAGEEITGTLKVQDEIVTTTGTGEAYEATVKGITELKAGVSFVMIPNNDATTGSPTLKVNDYPAIKIQRYQSTGVSYVSVTKTILKKGRPCRVMYDGTYWITVDYTVPVSAELSGRVPVSYGGVPSTNADNKGKVLTTNESGTPEWQTPSASEGGGTGVEQIAHIDAFNGTVQDASYNGTDGIVWNSTVEILDEESSTLGSAEIQQKVPIVAGENIVIQSNDDETAVVISAPESMLGEWVFNDEMIIPTEETSYAVDFEGVYGDNVYVCDTILLYDGGSGICYYGNGVALEDVYVEGWIDATYKKIKILKEPPAEASAWIKANAKRYQPIGADKVQSIDTYGGFFASNLQTDYGICWEEMFDFYEGNNFEGDIFSSGTISHRVPIAAGKNVEFEVDEEKGLVKINATGGGTSGNTVKPSEGLEYQLFNNNSYSVVGIGTCTDDFVIIPSEYEGLPVTDIYEYAFTHPAGPEYGEASFTSIFIPKSVTGMYISLPTGHPVTVFCEAESQPDSWYPGWQTDNLTVIWGFSLNTGGGGNSGSGLEMPQIRFTSANGYAPEGVSTFYVDEENPLKLTVEIVGGGALKVGDALQVCTRKRFNGSGENDFKRKYKLQRFAEYVVTENDLNSRFLTVQVFAESRWSKSYRGLFRDGNGGTISPLYLRIRRPKGDIQNNDSGQTVDAKFSNIVTIWKSHYRSDQFIRIY